MKLVFRAKGENGVQVPFVIGKGASQSFSVKCKKSAFD